MSAIRVLLLGHGRMGQLVESLAPSYGAAIAGIIDEHSGPDAVTVGDFGEVDVAIDFTAADAVPANFAQLAARGINVVIGTTGWQPHEAAMRQTAVAAGIGVLAGANFSVGMNLFQLVVEEAARRFGRHTEFGAWIHEAHHAAKRDAPSGTALALRDAMIAAGYPRAIDVSSTRAGAIAGTHTVGFDGGSDTITLTHTVCDRAVFARGALVAARWLAGRKGWFTFGEVLKGAEGS